jgi:hypothetical protein
MPFKNEHASRQTDPQQYKDFRRYQPKGFPKGVSVILGIDDKGKTEIQSIRANKDDMSPSEFKQWLKEHDFKDEVEEAQLEKGNYFATWIPFTTLAKAKKDNDEPEIMDDNVGMIAGIVSTDDMDFEGEKINQSGLDWSYFLNNGWFNHEHRPGPEAVLGHPTKIEKVDDHKTRVEGKLYLSKPLAKECYDTAVAMQKAGGERCLGFSIEGKVTLRDPIQPKKVLKANVINVAITSHPVNPNTNLEIIAKSMNVGYQEAAIPDADASMSSLVEQSLAQKVSSATYGANNKAPKKENRMISKEALKNKLKEHFSDYTNEELERLLKLVMESAKNKSQEKLRDYE